MGGAAVDIEDLSLVGPLVGVLVVIPVGTLVGILAGILVGTRVVTMEGTTVGTPMADTTMVGCITEAITHTAGVITHTGAILIIGVGDWDFR